MEEGILKEAFEEALGRIEEDCKGRPALKDARKLALVLEMKPVCDDNGDLETTSVRFHFVETIPKRKSREYSALPKEDGLYVNDVSPDNPKQRTIDEFKGPTIKREKQA